jgi:superfamily II DNA/RNA helicase
MGFYDDIMFVIKHLPQKRQNLLFSATMPPKIRTLAKSILHQPIEINIAISKPPEKINQLAYLIYEPQKIPLVSFLLKQTNFDNTLIFCSSKLSVKQLTKELKRLSFKADEIHSDLDQDKRESVLSDFRSGRLPILIATDILSRGIDIDNIELVINFDVPHDGEDYVHRIGRTARAKAKGSAYTLVNVAEQKKLSVIEQLLGYEVPKGEVPSELGETPERSTSHSNHHSKRRNHFNKK